MTLEQLAKELGVTRMTLYRVLRNNNMDIALLERLCKIFNVPLSYFFPYESFFIAIDEPDLNLSYYLRRETDPERLNLLRAIVIRLQLYQERLIASEQERRLLAELIAAKDELLAKLKNDDVEREE